MLQSLKNLKNKYYNYLLKTPVGKQEVDNFKLSLLLSLVLGNILTIGVDDNGNFKYEVFDTLVGFLLSEKSIYFAAYILVPFSLWTLLKMAIFKVSKTPWFNAIAQLVSGFFYSFGCGILMFLFASLYHGYGFNIQFLMFGLCSNFVGYGMYVMFQAAIQRTATPES